MSHNPQIDQATAMMVAAEYVEQEGRFDFMATDVPRSCHDKGCVLGWIGYVMGMNGALVDQVSGRLGYSHMGFYEEMNRVCDITWKLHPTLAATGLRRLARERTGGLCDG